MSPRSQEQRTRDMYRRVQLAYRRAIDAGRSPVTEVAQALGVSERVARQRIYRARRAGYDMHADEHVLDRPASRLVT